MVTNNSHVPIAILVALTMSSLPLSSCAPHLTPATTASPTAAATPTLSPTATVLPTDITTPLPLPVLTLNQGDFYFSLDGQPTFMLSRNPTGKTQEDFDTALEWAHQGGTKVIRVHLTHGWWGDPWINTDWTVNEEWAHDWEAFFDQAQADGIYVIPVFGVWADWNNGVPDWGSPLWQYNPLNSANGGPLDSPMELFNPGSDVQNHWMEWVRILVERWQDRDNIAAWEVFSEINIASGATGHTDAKGGVDEASAVEFTNKAMAVVHAGDSQQRPVTLSLAGVYSPSDQWAEYYELDSLDFIEIHPYSDKLDRELISAVRQHQTKYQKPVMIGESGLWAMTHNDNAMIGIQHAIWAALVSGAMNGRSLWDNDGYSIYSISNRDDAIAFMRAYASTELPVANFIKDVDFSGFHPLTSSSSSGVWGAAVGDETMVLGWFRDSTSEPPNWNLRPVVSKQTVSITVPGRATHWQVDFYNTKTGTEIVSTIMATRNGDTVTMTLPDFADDIAFKMHVER
jgi:hypothetical protein